MSGVLDLNDRQEVGAGDSGGASRFFHTFQMESPLIYQAKANKKERPTVDGTGHSTVKPLALMRNLVRLVTPPGGIILDPFGGSGTTGEAALLEGRNTILIEQDADYCKLIEVRLTKHDHLFRFEGTQVDSQ
jgi:site-specific DNA-methyltransferase (adenine-specific)